MSKTKNNTNANTINVVWLISARFEREWIWSLLQRGEWSIEEKDDIKLETLHPPNSIFIVNSSMDFESYFARYETACVPYAVIHLSDEYYKDGYKFYDHRMCSWVARNYWHPNLSVRPNVLTFGLGWKNGFAAAANDANPSPAKFEDRPYTVSFAGNIHHEYRRNFVKTFADVEPNQFHLTFDGFDSVKGLDINSYRSLMNKSKYVLCPIGHCNIDCFRVYEALEAGAIPITLSITSMQRWMYWEALTGTAVPWIAAPTMEEARVLLQTRLDSQIGSEGERVHEFWELLKSKWATEFKRLISQMLQTVA